MTERPPTIGQAVSGLDLPTAGCWAALALILIGSLGPWLTAPLTSAAGTDGDGKWTAILAIVAATGLARRRLTSGILFAACVLIVALGSYNAVHLHHAAAHAVLFGRQLDHVGWGVYAVTIGAAIPIVVQLRAWWARPREH